MKLKSFFLAFMAFILVGCSILSPTPANTSTPAPTPTTIGKVEYSVTRAPDPQSTAQAFLKAWKNEDYTTMYGMLTSISKDAISQDNFTKRYANVAVATTLKNIDFQILSSLTNPGSSQISYKVTFHTTLLGDITPDNMVMNLTLTNGTWQIAWDDGMIMPALKGGNQLRLDYDIPSRGDIYDSSGTALVAQADAVALGVVPGEIKKSQEANLLKQLSSLTGFDTSYIKDLYKNAGSDWYVVIGEASAEDVSAREDILSNLSGLRMNSFRSRYYYNEGIAAQTIGYVQSISSDELEKYERAGYSIGQKVGKTGIEYWGESYLAGKNGATLYVTDSNGQIITRLAHVDPTPAQSIYTTLDESLQYDLQKTLGNFKGAVVVIERNTGKVLAMVSNPTFDPNIFEPTNKNSTALASLLNDSSDQPLYNRATQGQYPLGSVFKIITMAAALESGLYKADTKYTCGSSFTELAGITLYDWTYSYGLPASGVLTLSQGLMRSCDPYFWHIGLDLYNQGLTTAVSSMARSFGLGKDTGFELSEQPGSMPDPESSSDAVQLAIGQGTMMVTPLQVAEFLAAVGNGGTLYQPQIISKIVSTDGTVSNSFSAISAGKLPVSDDNLKIIQNALRSVVTDPDGTAHGYLGSLGYPVAGKTGTAQNPNGDAHAWFAGYSMMNDPTHPDIAVAVLVENAGEGSLVAAPIFRRVISLYFSDGTDYGITMPWESSPYVVASATPSKSETDTPTAEPTTADTDTPTP